ncbi:MAG: hypothetical protein E6Q83_01420 [Thiothrix sp.]|nr:MAG: hypothetical protein E6Q83_01420 [Thiothrix sp.]
MRWLKLSTIGLLLAGLFFVFSLTPSLGPRTPFMQGVISGVSMALGYALGAFLAWLWAYLGFKSLPEHSRGWLIILAILGLVVSSGWFLWRSSAWQNSIREMMHLPANTQSELILEGGVALLIFVLLMALGFGFKRLFLVFTHFLERFIPKKVAAFMGILLVAWLYWAAINDVLLTRILQAVDRSYQKLDALVQTEVDKPISPLKSGSAESLVQWQDLGGQGRNYISLGPKREQLQEFAPQAIEPLRVYVGLNSADTPQARAQLALDELKRVKAFERSTLLLMTPTGTGWIDPGGIDTLEYLLHGDIASVAVQYSYLPSPLSLALEASYGADTAQAAFDVIYTYWASLPKDSRPKLYLYGISLGSRNSDLSFDLFDIINDPPQGVLWVGPPFSSRTWNKVTYDRNPSSPVWLPQFRDGAVVRFMNHEFRPEDSQGAWGKFRIIYLQYASDPIVFFDPKSFYREPAYLKPPRGADVSPDLQWFPAVTMLQTAADMALVSAPVGYGHNYAAVDYIEAWLGLLEPTSWTPEELARLKNYFKQRPVPYN